MAFTRIYFNNFTQKRQMLLAAVNTAIVRNTSKHGIPPLNVNGLLKETKGASHGGFLKVRMLQDVLSHYHFLGHWLLFESKALKSE